MTEHGEMVTGAYTVPIRTGGMFGDELVHGIPGNGPIAYAWRHRLDGWRMAEWFRLHHQTYVDAVRTIILDHGPDTVAEVAIVDLWSGEWRTVYLKRGQTASGTRLPGPVAMVTERLVYIEALYAALSAVAVDLYAALEQFVDEASWRDFHYRLEPFAPAVLDSTDIFDPAIRPHITAIIDRIRDTTPARQRPP
jgi:hypothetical protein